MVIGAFPAAKLGALLLKQVSKPIANVLKNQAKSSPVFRKYVCMPPAQFYNWCEIKSKMWILNLGRPVNIPVLNEAQAIELGANLLGEAIIFIIAAGILINEYNRSVAKETAKEQARLDEMSSLKNDIRELYIQGEEERAQIRELLRKVGQQHGQIQELADKLGIHHKPVQEQEPPPYSPSTNDPNISKMQKPEVYQLGTGTSTPTNIILLRSVDEIARELFGSSTNNPETTYVTEALLYLSKLFRF